MNLSLESSQLIYFINSISKSFKNPRTNKNTTDLIKFISYNINYLYNDIKKNTVIHPLYIKKVITYKDMLYPSNFYIKTQYIYEHITNKIKSLLHYTFTVFSRRINVYFFVEEPSPITNKYNEYICKIMTWLSLIHNYSSNKCSRTLDIYIYLTSLTKKIPINKDKVLDEFEINSAYTTSCPVNGNIIIFRKEEFFKVFIHETFHSFNLDFSSMDTVECTKYMLRLFNVKSNVKAYEAYAEFWAEIINIIFFSCLNKYTISYIINMINYERIYSLFQMVKILNYMGITYNDIISSNCKKFKENTNVLSYFIIKTVLLYNYSDFLNFCIKNNTDPEFPINFKKTLQSQKRFCNFIHDNYNNDLFIQDIKIIEHLFYTNNKNLFINTNLRMSLYD